MSKPKAFVRVASEYILIVALVVVAAIAVYSLFGDVVPTQSR